jgi:N-carbamoylputrescine amidase
VRVALVSDTGSPETVVTGARSNGADVLCLPHLSFLPYFPASLDRGGLELAERSPSRTFEAALEHAGDAWVCGSTYESVGEGVFYATARIGRAGGAGSASRQRHVEAAVGRWEQLFFSPGFEPLEAVELPAGRAAVLIGLDLRSPSSWAEAAALGARIVIGGASEPAELWATTRRIASGMAASYGLTALVANRAGSEGDTVFAGGAAAFGPDGEELAISSEGIVEVEQ